MAVDRGLLTERDDVVTAAASLIGLDAAVVLQAANSVNFLRTGILQIREMIRRHRNPEYN